MQILRTKGTKSKGWGGYLICTVYPPYLPTLMFRYMPKTSTKLLRFMVGYASPFLPRMHSDIPIGMNAATCIRYWDNL